MTIELLLFAHLVAGSAAGILVLARAAPRTWSTLASALAAFAFWPLWLPFALSPSRPRAQTRTRRVAETRIAAALARARNAAEGTELEGVLTPADAEHMLAEVERIGLRLDAIEAELAATAGSDRRDRRLTALRDADVSALEEILELAELLATELALARHGRADGVEPLVVELALRIEALGEAN